MPGSRSNIGQDSTKLTQGRKGPNSSCSDLGLNLSFWAVDIECEELEIETLAFNNYHISEDKWW